MPTSPALTIWSIPWRPRFAPISAACRRCCCKWERSTCCGRKARRSVADCGDAGVDVDFEIFPGLTHGFMRTTESVARSREALAKVGAWLRRVTK